MTSFDAAPLFNAIPSFYRDHLTARDKGVVAKLWEGMTRIIEAEYSQLFQVSDAPKIGRAATNTFYPYVYQTFDSWQSRKTQHQHVIVRAMVASTTSITFNRRLDLTAIKIYYAGRRIALPTGWSLTHSTDGTSTILSRTSGSSTPFTLNTQITLESSRELVSRLIVGDGALTSVTLYRRDHLNVSHTAVIDQRSVNLDLVLPSGYKVRLIGDGVVCWGVVYSDRVVFNKPIPSGQTIRITDRAMTQSFVTSGFQSVIALQQPVNPDTTSVFLCGLDLTAIQITSSGVNLNRPLKIGAEINLEAALWTPHDHARLTFVNINQFATNIPIPITRPLALTPNITEDPRYPIKVYVNGLLLNSTGYVFSNTTQIQLTTPLLIGDRIDVIYVDAEDSVGHAHITQITDVVSDGIFSAATMPEKVDSSRYPFYVETYATTYTSGVGTLISDADVTTTDDLIFAVNPTIAGPISVYLEGIVEALEFRTIIDPRVDESERYEGTLISAERLQGGIDVPSKTSSGETLVVRRSGSRTVVESNYDFKSAWFINALVDEHTLSETLGTIVGLPDRGETDDQYVRVIKSLYTALYKGSQTSTIENFACHILGSDIATQSGANRGYYQDNDQTYLRVGDQNVLVDSAIPVRPAPATVPQFFAPNAHCEIIEHNLLDAPNNDKRTWLAFIAEAFSDDYRYAKRLDQYSPELLDSITGTYNPESSILTDYSVNFEEYEIWKGDLIEATRSDGLITRTRVLEVLDAYNIRVTLPITRIRYGWGGTRTPVGTNTGWGGDNAVSLPQSERSGWGGVAGSTSITRYKIWCRKTRRKDSHLFTDEMLDAARALSDGESVQIVSQKMATLLSRFLFMVRIDWNAHKDSRKLADLKAFLDRVKPADTNYAAFAEFNNSEGVSDKVEARIIDREADLSFIPRYTFISEDYMNYMYLTGDG